MTTPSASDCIFCNPDDSTFRYLLHETPHFRVICDTHPLAEGHLLIIPKEHVSCIGAYSESLLREFVTLYDRFSNFIHKGYGSVSTFEHGVFGQTIFHSHVHIIPYVGKPQEIVPEGDKHYQANAKLEDLHGALERDGGYLFFSIGDEAWLVDPALSKPRFFRDRYAKALHVTERMDWKAAQADAQLMEQFRSENQSVFRKWNVAI